MRIVEKNEGAKIEYEVHKKKITFDDDLTINLEKRQEDWDVHIDVCFDQDHTLVLGAAAGRAYVAEIDIPARTYTVTDAVSDNEGMERETSVPEPLNMDDVTLTLWAVE